jgi:Zn-dependent peptidase ImmA (M78 family)/transcriptional regulator with XRE-family HTH domain
MSKESEILVNNHVLVWARESLALSKNHVVEKTKISIRRLIQIENAEVMPTLDELKTLSKIYKRTIATLLLTKVPKENPLPKDRRTVNSENIGQFHPKTIIAIRKARSLAQSYVELRNELGMDIPKFLQVANLYDSPKDVAMLMRKALQLDNLKNLENLNIILDSYIERLENSGIVVYQLSLTQDNLRGISIVDDVMPIICIKRGGESVTAKIFTLFHELGHILLSEGGICDLSEKSTSKVEMWCNSFASHILISRDELVQIDIVRNRISKENFHWTKKELVDIGNYFHVGPLSILRVLLECNLTNKQFYQQKHLLWNKPSFGRSKTPEGRNIPKETIKEKGRTFISLAFNAYDSNKIDLRDLSDFLGIKLSYIPKTRQLISNY